jgi:formamidopyrimidine-DNA glycosylase
MWSGTGYHVFVPELPDLTLYVEALERRIVGSTLESTRIVNPFLLRTTTPTPDEFEATAVIAVARVGKRIVLEFEHQLFMAFHLMILGRMRWREPRASISKRGGLAAFDFSTGTLILTEAGTKRRASLHLVRGRAGLAVFDRGGLEVMRIGLSEFRDRLRQESHTLKRSLTDPSLFAGIGNAYSDEILHRARLSPFKQSVQLDDGEIERLFAATTSVLEEWTDRLRHKVGVDFPERVTAFRDDMAVHGRFGQPCPDCGAPVQRIVYAESEANYCPGCQTGGRILADRSLSRLLKADWPRSLDDLERLDSSSRD